VSSGVSTPPDSADGALQMVACRVCRTQSLGQGTLCVYCLEVRNWSAVNRAFCNLLHRASRPVRKGAGSLLTRPSR